MIRSIYKPHQFNLLSLLGLMTIISLIAIRNSFWATILAIELIGTHVFTTALVANLPSAILGGMVRNCLRLDGELDQERVKEERKELNYLYWRVMSVLWVLFLLPINCSLWCFDSGVYTPDAFFFAAGLLWIFFASLLLRLTYFNLLEKLQFRTACRHENYWIEDANPSQKSPFGD